MKQIINLLLIYATILLSQSCNRNTNEVEKDVICNFTVNIGDFDRNGSVVSVPLDKITLIPDTNLTLFEIIDNKRIQTDIQIEITGNKRYLYWILKGNSPKNTCRYYDLVKKGRSSDKNHFPVSINNKKGGYEFSINGKKILKYNSDIVEPPKGVESSYKRSGFINPLYSPDQTILTRIPDSASDHLHHYGLWNAWKKVIFRGEEIDFFAPQFGQGTIRHTGIVSINEGPVFSNLQALREHITWQDTKRETIAMSDLMDIKVYNTNKDCYLIDISYNYNPVKPFLIKEYRYAGFSFRATDLWTKENTTFFTSEGLNRNQADGERSRWCVVTGETSNGKSSIQFMSHPVNFNHPEPMRIWPSSSNKGVGNVFINYNPARNTDWPLQPKNSYLLRYRLLVTKGPVTNDQAEKAWNEFSNPAKVNYTVL